jgi:hypothetical protein
MPAVSLQGEPFISSKEMKSLFLHNWEIAMECKSKRWTNKQTKEEQIQRLEAKRVRNELSGHIDERERN